MYKSGAVIRDAWNFAGTLSLKKIWNYSLIRCSYYRGILLGKPVHAGMPVSLSVEPANTCNLRCPECPAGSGTLTRRQGIMDLDAFRNLIGQLKDRLAYLMLYFQGEPMMNPAIFDMIAYARKLRVYTSMSTNGHLLDDENARKLVVSGLDRLIVSVDGADQDTYALYRRGGDLARVKEGLMRVAAWKKEMNSRRPYLIIQFVVFSFNEHQLDDMRKLAREAGAGRLIFKSAQISDLKQNGWMVPRLRKLSRYDRGADGEFRLKHRLKNRCFRMWQGAVVTWDGRLVPCCFDKDAMHALGDTGEEPFRDLWKGNDYDLFRKAILENRPGIAMCRNCSE